MCSRLRRVSRWIDGMFSVPSPRLRRRQDWRVSTFIRCGIRGRHTGSRTVCICEQSPTCLGTHRQGLPAMCTRTRATRQRLGRWTCWVQLWRWGSSRGDRVGVNADFQPLRQTVGNRKPLTCQGKSVVGDTGFEPVTSSVSGKRATAAPIARAVLLFSCRSSRWVRDLNPCKRICSPLPRLSANPPLDGYGDPLRADDGIRTRDPHLGKVMLYH